MRAISLLFVLAWACSGAQVIMAGSGSRVSDGVQFRYETRVEPELPSQKTTGIGGGIHTDGRDFHRFLTDTKMKRYFGYDLSIEPGNQETFRVTLKPLTLSAEKLELKPPGEWSQLALPPLPLPQVVHRGDSIALDLFVHPNSGQKIVDYLFIADNRVSLRLSEGPPRDYTLDDVPLTLSKVRLKLNGRQINEWGGTMTGTAMYFYLPDHGRFVFSLSPNEDLGFRKAGEVRGNALTITSGTDTYTVECDAPVAPGGGVFNLYVYRDASWRPRGGPDEFHLGASSARSPVSRRK